VTDNDSTPVDDVTSVSNELIAEINAITDAAIASIRWRIVIGHLKGGVGKSTSAWMLAIEIYLRTGRKPLVACADPLSQTVMKNYQVLLAAGVDVPFHVITWHDPNGLVKGVEQHRKNLDVDDVVIDVGGESEKILQGACIYGDDLLIPTKANKTEMQRIRPTLQAAAQVEHLGEVVPSILFVQEPDNSRFLRIAREQFDDEGWSDFVLSTSVPTRNDYKHAMAQVPADTGRYRDVLAEIALRKLAA
jgi:cellulose biosynthesis protein BcsQ